MTDAQEPTPTPPPSEPQPAAPAGQAPPKKGMSTGAKVAIGCGVLVVLAIVVFAVAAVVGGFFVKKKAEQFAGGVKAQQEASETLQELEQRHPFEPPADGVVSDEEARTFFAVTDAAWDEMKDWAQDMEQRSERADERGRATMGDAMAGMHGIQQMGRARVAIAKALDDHDTSVTEYLWTGRQLLDAYEALDQPPAESSVPQANRDLAARHRDKLAEISEDRDQGGTGEGMVYWLAWTWGASEGMPHAMGWDTLQGMDGRP